MRLHILGICGTFMAGIALLAKKSGFLVTGSDTNVYPPMSTQLLEQDIKLFEGYEDLSPFSTNPELVIVGNSIKRGNPCVEYMLNKGLAYTSGPQWLADHILKNHHVLAVAGTHGKTTVTSLLSWILEYVDLNPGFLIGGIAKNFKASAQLGGGTFFVIEADEYDTAFFDKRSKFIHYRPRTLVLNNLEFDHADIFPNLKAIKLQFSYLLRTVPSEGLIICPRQDTNLQDVLAEGCWAPVSYLGSHTPWQASLIKSDGSQFSVHYQKSKVGEVNWSLLGKHNVANALAAIVAAHHVGVEPSQASAALNEFQGIKRRLEFYQQVNQILLYDDFAHHPTAIASTLEGLRNRIGKKRILAIIQCNTHSMRSGTHDKQLASSLKSADKAWLIHPEPGWSIKPAQHPSTPSTPLHICHSVETLVESLAKETKPDDHIVIMSNSRNGNLHEKLVLALSQLTPP